MNYSFRFCCNRHVYIQTKKFIHIMIMTLVIVSFWKPGLYCFVNNLDFFAIFEFMVCKCLLTISIVMQPCSRKVWSRFFTSYFEWECSSFCQLNISDSSYLSVLEFWNSWFKKSVVEFRFNWQNYVSISFKITCNQIVHFQVT